MGTDAEIAVSLEVLERFAERKLVGGCGLPPTRLPGIDIVSDFAAKAPDLVEGLEVPLFLRSKDGLPVPLLRPGFGDTEGRGLPLLDKPSNTALISGGIGTWWMMLTDRQSAAGMSLYSLGEGGRQQPGQPGLLYPDCLGGGGGSVRAHCLQERVVRDAIWEITRSMDLAISAAVEAVN